MTIYFYKEDIVRQYSEDDYDLEDMIDHYYIINNRIIHIYYSDKWSE